MHVANVVKKRLKTLLRNIVDHAHPIAATEEIENDQTEEEAALETVNLPTAEVEVEVTIVTESITEIALRKNHQDEMVIMKTTNLAAEKKKLINLKNYQSKLLE
jgi:hypothetical protein